jgi:hypothetical protein
LNRIGAVARRIMNARLREAAASRMKFNSDLKNAA